MHKPTGTGEALPLPTPATVTPSVRWRRRALESGKAFEPSSRLLIVDDQPDNLKTLNRILQKVGYRDIHCTTDPQEAIELYRTLQPDLVLLDLHMPQLNGLEVLAALRALTPAELYLPVLMLTGDDTPEARQNALAMGAKDFLAKPFDLPEVLLRIGNLLETSSLHRRLHDQNRQLESRVLDRTRELEAAQVEILERLAGAAEFRDDDTGQHTQRVGQLSARLARAVGLPTALVRLIRRAAPLHDVGKIGIPDRVLLKTGPLDADETALMRTHTTIGAAILSGGRSELIQEAERIALGHHERWDGSGYPYSTSGDRIPLTARIVAVADVYDALTNSRPYRVAWPVPRVLEELDRLCGKQFDPELVKAFVGTECYKNLGEDAAEESAP
jgi:response regulator RpfG family c-di-GMP phosphodiesterase